MGVWLDDEFPEHEKVEALGDDLAAWLYVAGLCYANRNLTGGRIPKARALLLTTSSTKKRVDRLCAVLIPGRGPLWEDRGDHYLIHNYGPRQQSAEKRRAEKEEEKRKRSEHARKAAEAKHRAEKEQRLGTNRAGPEQPPGSDGADERAGPEQGNSLAGASALRAADPTPLTQPIQSSSNHHGVAPASADDDDWAGVAYEQAVAECTDRRMARTHANDPQAYRPKVVQSVEDELGEHIRRLLGEGSSVAEVVDQLEPLPARPASPVALVPSPYPAAGEQAEPAWADVDDQGFAVPAAQA